MNILGLMSGSSLDGLDMALCTFTSFESQSIDYEILLTEKREFPDNIAERLKSVTKLSSMELQALDADLSLFFGEVCKQFIASSSHEVDLIASHGHTVFHFPDKHITTQLGNGGIISQICERDVVSDFRSSDVGAGGLGAPFAPIADFYLFPEVDLLLNLGGISNISFKKDGNVKAFDISPANQILNYLALQKGHEYDEDGIIASEGKVLQDLLNEFIALNNLTSFNPRALDNSWVMDNFIPKLSKTEIEDQLRTTVEFINLETIKAIEFLNLEKRNLTLMVTGGGAFNKFLMDNLKFKLQAIKVEILDVQEEIIEYKEALLIALMGYLRVNRISNTLSSVTGANRNTIGGCIYAY